MPIDSEGVGQPYNLLSAGVDSDDANSVMDLIRNKFLTSDLSSLAADDSGIKLVGAEEFS